MVKTQSDKSKYRVRNPVVQTDHISISPFQLSRALFRERLALSPGMVPHQAKKDTTFRIPIRYEDS